MSGADDIRVGAISFGPAQSSEDSMAESIVALLARLAEVEAERDFYKAAAEKLRKNKFAAVIEGRSGDIPARSDLSRRTTLRRRKQ